MSSLGSYLIGLRQGCGLSIEEMARSTRVASRYLEALETDNFEALPRPVFVRGFIRAYCQALDVPPDEALARYGESIGEPVALPEPSANPTEGRAQPKRSRGTVLVSFILLVILGLTLFTVTMLLQSGRESVTGRRARTPASEAPTPEPPPSPAAASPIVERTVSPAPAAPPAAVASPAPDAAPATAGRQVPSAPPAPAAPPTPAPEPQPAVSEPRPAATISAGELATLVGEVTSPYRLIARVSELTWIRVRMEDGRISEETIPAGQVREWVSNTPFVLTVGNAGGVRLELNGRELPQLGARGTVISRLVIPPTPQ